VFNYTTCADCHGTLNATVPGQTVHPVCTPQPTKLDALVAEFLAAAMAGNDIWADELEAQIATVEHAPPRLLDAALIYASWGWGVFPLLAVGEVNPWTGEISDGKKPATRHGFKDATTEADQIKAWWADGAQCNIGLATGGRFDVIDIDPRHGGMTTYRHILEREDERGEGALPDTHGRVITAGGGWHLYVEPLGGGNRANVLPGIDIRGKGGYVVAPPSWLGEHRKRWSWAYKPSPKIRA
jgi:hypothetical protein